MRTNGDNYLYEIQLSSITGSTNPACSGANICQVKPNDEHFSRKVGTSDRTKYYVQGITAPLAPHPAPRGGLQAAADRLQLAPQFRFKMEPQLGASRFFSEQIQRPRRPEHPSVGRHGSVPTAGQALGTRQRRAGRLPLAWL